MSVRNIKPFKNQVYDQIKCQCAISNKLFVDDQFPPNASSLYKFSPPRSRQSIVWKRPSEITTNPQFFVNKADRNDLSQGEIGDCWFIAAAVAITSYPEYINNVVPPDQTFDPRRGYSGIFHFRFYQHGDWFDVVVDDLLPVDKYTNKLIYCHNKKEKNEFWCALLEKAYAKLHSCYEFLDAGLTQYALIDMTSGVDESIELDGSVNRDRAKIEITWKIATQAHKMNSLIGACIFPSRQGYGREAELTNGLVVGHAYTITKLIEVQQQSQYFSLFDYQYQMGSYYSNNRPSDSKVRLVRLRNPWGNSVEWKGRFSDNSVEWRKISEHDKREIGLVRESDGEFWYMSL
jgi:calpain-5